MYSTIRIQNFRQFDDLLLSGLSRVNLFVGRHGTGKTSLLEALLLLSEIPVRETIAELRGRRDRDYWECSQCVLEELMSLFRDPGREIYIRATGDGGVDYSLKIYGYSIKEKGGDYGPLTLEEGTVGKIFGLTYEHRGYSSIIVIPKEGTPTIAEATRAPNVSFRAMSSPLLEFRETQEDSSVLHELYRVSEKSAAAMDIGVRLLQSQRGLLLVDGIENGLHWAILEPVWREIGNLAHRLGVQIFATTYSYECIKAAHKALGNISLCRLEKEGDRIKPVMYDPEILEIALEEKLEVR